MSKSNPPKRKEVFVVFTGENVHCLAGFSTLVKNSYEKNILKFIKHNEGYIRVFIFTEDKRVACEPLYKNTRIQLENGSFAHIFSNLNDAITDLKCEFGAIWGIGLIHGWGPFLFCRRDFEVIYKRTKTKDIYFSWEKSFNTMIKGIKDDGFFPRENVKLMVKWNDKGYECIRELKFAMLRNKASFERRHLSNS